MGVQVLNQRQWHVRQRPPTQVLYEMKRSMPNFYSKQGLPTTEGLDDFIRDKRHKLIVVDDLMHEVMRNKDMELLFTLGTHHKCVSVILITQNLYPGEKHARTIALNTWYMVLLTHLRDVSQVGILGRQLYPGKPKGFLKAYEDALSGGKHGYFVVDMCPHAQDQYRLRTRVFPGEDPIVYRLT